MTWDVLLPVIIANGLSTAEKLWQLWVNKAAPTQADWDALKVLGQQNARTQMMLALARGGIDPNSDQGKAFLALTP